MTSKETACILNLENQLFSEWALKRKEFSPDGMIEENSYLESNLKVLFLMKEVNSINGFDLKQFIKDGGRPQTWDNIARWVYGIRNIEREIEWAELEKINTEKQRQELFKSICVMNLKKSPGSYIANHNELWRIAEEDKIFLKNQFKIYFENEATRPDIIIACGSATTNIFCDLIGFQKTIKWEMTSRGIWYYEYDKERFFICYSHPEARVQDSLLYYGLIDAIKELMTKTKNGLQ